MAIADAGRFANMSRTRSDADVDKLIVHLDATTVESCYVPLGSAVGMLASLNEQWIDEGVEPTPRAR